jgi:hypothetical protein
MERGAIGVRDDGISEESPGISSVDEEGMERREAWASAPDRTTEDSW